MPFSMFEGLRASMAQSHHLDSGLGTLRCRSSGFLISFYLELWATQAAQHTHQVLQNHAAWFTLSLKPWLLSIDGGRRGSGCLQEGRDATLLPDDLGTGHRGAGIGGWAAETSEASMAGGCQFATSPKWDGTFQPDLLIPSCL